MIYPEAATNMFNRAMSLLQEGNGIDAMQYLSLSLQYEPRAQTGHAQIIQSDWRTETLYLMTEADKTRILVAAPSWRLLLQLDSADRTNMEWGDSGRLYFLIDDASLKSGDFSKVWVSMQCY